VLSVWLLQKHARHHAAGAQPGRLARAFGGLLGLATRLRWAVVPAYLAAAGGLLFFPGPPLGAGVFPPVGARQFPLRLRAPTGTRIEQTEDITREALNFIKEKVGPDNVRITLGYVGVVSSSYPINTIYQWMGGPEEAVMRVALRPGAARVEQLKR